MRQNFVLVKIVVPSRYHFIFSNIRCFYCPSNSKGPCKRIMNVSNSTWLLFNMTYAYLLSSGRYKGECLSWYDQVLLLPKVQKIYITQSFHKPDCRNMDCPLSKHNVSILNAYLQSSGRDDGQPQSIAVTAGQLSSYLNRPRKNHCHQYRLR